jgi:hypothetical protein
MESIEELPVESIEPKLLCIAGTVGGRLRISEELMAPELPKSRGAWVCAGEEQRSMRVCEEQRSMCVHGPPVSKQCHSG